MEKTLEFFSTVSSTLSPNSQHHTSNRHHSIKYSQINWTPNNYYNYNHLTASFPGQPGYAGTRKVKPIWMLPEQETVSGSGISRAIWKSAPRSKEITTPVPHHCVFYRPDALPAAQPTASKHWRHKQHEHNNFVVSIYDFIPLKKV